MRTALIGCDSPRSTSHHGSVSRTFDWDTDPSRKAPAVLPSIARRASPFDAVLFCSARPPRATFTVPSSTSTSARLSVRPGPTCSTRT
jgi:hypothetical protein